MKIINKIARAELRTLFYSPIAWLVLLAFYITSAAIVTVSMEKFATFQDVAAQLDPDWKGFIGGIEDHIFKMTMSKILDYIFLFIPLLTMGLINREVVNGTNKLLYSSPVTTREIVLGKYLGMVVFNLFIICILAFVLFSLSFNIDKSDTYRAFSILLAFFLLMNAFAAIGLFLSSLTNYQIVAAILTFAVFFLLASLTRIGQQYNLVREISFVLSLAGKATLLLNGLITSRDVIYFLLIMVLFVGYTIIKLDSTRQTGNRAKLISRYAILTLAVILVGYISAKPKWIGYLDVTDNKKNTIHPVVQDAIKRMDGSELTVTLYTNLLGSNAGYGLPQARTNYAMWYWGQYIRFYPNIRLNYEYYYDVMDGDSTFFRRYPGKTIHEIAAIQADILGIRTSIFKSPAEIRKQIDLGDEMNLLVMQLEYKGKKTFLRTYKDPAVWPDQEHVAAAIMQLTREKVVKVYFAAGHYERNAFNHTAYDYFIHTASKERRHSLINKGVTVDSLSLTGPLPNMDVLVVANPKSAYSQAEQEKIISWIDKGGNTIIYTEPGKQDILAPVLKEIGIQADNGIVVRPNKHETPILFNAKLTKAGNYIAKEESMQLFQDYGLRGGQVIHDGLISLNFSPMKGFTATPIITLPGDEETWIENGKLVVDSAAPLFSAAEGDTRKPEYITAYALTRNINGKEQRIIVAGDADFMSYQRMLNDLYHIGLATYSYTLNNEYPPYANKPLAKDLHLTLTPNQAKWMFRIYVFGISGAILLAAILLLVRRKRK
ncbi:ABC transporter permease subunit [Pseudoflavitalea rhizosphaerae]|uniref:ABC transporter permease subunit n=1 Tax=Pseudoflavitalea rhizosphaerae TaxID=1884793 RepID=UPI000F8CA413|nr:Gldg family protein [Pseudoflavitalea rhizosphaerae]